METVLSLPDVMYHVFKFLSVRLVYKTLFISPDCGWMLKREVMLGMLRKRITDRDTTGLSLGVVINLCLYRRIRNKVFCCYEDIMLFEGGKIHTITTHHRIPDRKIKYHPELNGMVECAFDGGAIDPTIAAVLIALDHEGRVCQLHFNEAKDGFVSVALPVNNIIQIVSTGYTGTQFLLDNKGYVYVKYHSNNTLERLSDIPYIARMVEGNHCVYLVDGSNEFHKFTHRTTDKEVMNCVPNGKTTERFSHLISLCDDRIVLEITQRKVILPHRVAEVHDCWSNTGLPSVLIVDTDGKVFLISVSSTGDATTNYIEGVSFPPISSHIQELGQTLRVEWGTTTVIS
jgi:hypothetical protein